MVAGKMHKQACRRVDRQGNKEADAYVTGNSDIHAQTHKNIVRSTDGKERLTVKEGGRQMKRKQVRR